MTRSAGTAASRSAADRQPGRDQARSCSPQRFQDVGERRARALAVGAAQVVDPERRAWIHTGHAAGADGKPVDSTDHIGQCGRGVGDPRRDGRCPEARSAGGSFVSGDQAQRVNSGGLLPSSVFDAYSELSGGDR